MNQTLANKYQTTQTILHMNVGVVGASNPNLTAAQQKQFSAKVQYLERVKPLTFHNGLIPGHTTRLLVFVPTEQDDGGVQWEAVKKAKRVGIVVYILYPSGDVMQIK